MPTHLKGKLSIHLLGSPPPTETTKSNLSHSCIIHRSSDSTKYGTNKSSGASVTSSHQQKHHISSITHDSVSNRKPPMHPNHHQCNYNNHKFISTTTTTPSITNTQSIPVVHNANNRLPNNTIFQNNQYTFSLNRNGGDGGGYLDPRPLSAASLYGDGQRVVRGTKSDIGVPCRRPSTTATAAAAAKSMLHHTGHNNGGPTSHAKSKLPSVKSDFLLSYLNNNSKSNEMHNTSAYFISDGTTATTTATMANTACAPDYLEPYRSDNSKRRLYSSSSKLEHIDLHANRTNKYYQRERTHNFGRQSNAITNENSNNVGPLLYLDSFEQFNNDKSAFSNAQYQSMQSVSKTYNA